MKGLAGVAFVAFSVGLGACRGDQADVWEPVGEFDCDAVLSADSAPLLGEVELVVWVYRASGDEDDLEFTPEIPDGFVGSVDSRIEPRDVGWLHTYDLHLRPRKIGLLEIPPFEISYSGEVVTTIGFELEVASVLRASDQSTTVEEPASLFPARYEAWPFVLGGLGLVLLGLFVWWSLSRRRVHVFPVEVPLVPHVKALRALTRLRQFELETAEAVDAFYVEVSRILRVYLEDRFGLHAPLRSTEEFLAEVESGDQLAPEHRIALRGFLHQCDLVKFARLVPADEIHGQILQSARAFVEQTRSDGFREDVA